MRFVLFTDVPIQEAVWFEEACQMHGDIKVEGIYTMLQSRKMVLALLFTSFMYTARHS